MENVDEALIEETNGIKIIAVGITEYDYLNNLPGSLNDLNLIKEIFISTPNLSIYKEDCIQFVENPTVDELKEILLQYSQSISSHGDTLIFYFSGHGYVSANGDFGLCCKDTRLDYSSSDILPLSVLNFSDVVKTLSVLDIFSCFIIDACFSHASSKVGEININLQIEYETSRLLGNSYAFFSSSSRTATSLSDSENSFFTSAIHETVMSGLDNDQNNPYIVLSDLPILVDNKLKSVDAPLSRIIVGYSFPNIGIAKNINYDPKTRTERFIKSYKELLEYAWNNGDPICFSRKEIRMDMPTGYGNHSKFGYIWGLLEDGIKPNGEKCRRLTAKGIDFIKEKISIPREMRRIEDSEEWVPTENSIDIFYSDL